MPHVQLPLFPNGSVEINQDLACRVEGGQVVYFNGHLPVFAHGRDDLASFRLFTAQLIVQGSATQGDISRAFGVPLVTIKRSTKLYRERGPAGFFAPKARREGTKLNSEKLAQAKALLARGQPLAVVSRETGVLTDTLRKAIQAKRRTPCRKPSVTASCVRKVSTLLIRSRCSPTGPRARWPESSPNTWNAATTNVR